VSFSLWVYSGGWVYYPMPDSEIEVRIRFAERGDGRLEAVDVWVSDKQCVNVSALRAVPLPKIEAAVNRPEIAEQLRAKMDEEQAMPEAELIALRNRLASRAPAKLDPSIWAPPEARLDIPPMRRKPDSFYRQVAEAYQALASSDPRPAVALAEANRVPVTTIHRWVKGARARGFLAPARRLAPRQRKAGS